jgi:23S rRNA pseudouridine2604 synthase
MPKPKPPLPNTTGPMRLNRYLAHAGIATRREADALIEQGRVFVNGEKAKLGMRVTDADDISVEEANRRKLTYLAYYKPRGIITHSPQGLKERAINDIVEMPGVFPVGRLDKASEGLIILTNDGRVTERLLHPRFAHEKEYEVSVQEAIAPKKLILLEQGIVDQGERLTAKKATLTSQHTLSITLTEGKKHQIRRMLAALHLTVVSLKRVRIMQVHLGALKPGQSRPLAGIAKEAFLRDLDLQ